MPSATTRLRPDWELISRLALGAVLGAGSLVMYAAGDEVAAYLPGRRWLVLDILLGLVALAALVYRRRRPVPVLLATALLATLSVTAGGPAMVAVASICARQRWKELVLAGVAMSASIVVYGLVHPTGEPGATVIAWSLAIGAANVAVGWLIGEWRKDRRAAWATAWRMVLALAVGLVLYVAVISEGKALGFDEGDLWLHIDPLVGMVAVALLPLRRRWPLAVLIVASCLSAVAATASGAALLALVSLATSRDWRKITLGAAINLTTGLLFGFVHNVWGGLTDVVSNVTVVALCIAIGLFIGARRELVDNLRAQVEGARREQEARVAQARTSERARIAREMHDVLAHRISLVAMHAGALAYRDDLPPEQVRKTANLLHETSHHALTELREVLGVLRDQDVAAAAVPEPPQPTLADLDEMVAGARAGGQQIDLDLRAEVEALPEVLSRNGYRIVQESLTNARKHAPEAPVTVTLAGGPGSELDLQIRNPRVDASSEAPTPPGAGLGLVGLRERATLSGGTLSASTDRKHEFVIRAVLPWPEDEESDG